MQSVQRPDVVLTNAGSKSYGATWADTDTIASSAIWFQSHGMNKLAADMQRLLTDPYVLQVWERTFSRPVAVGIFDVYTLVS